MGKEFKDKIVRMDDKNPNLFIVSRQLFILLALVSLLIYLIFSYFYLEKNLENIHDYIFKTSNRLKGGT